MQYVKTSDRSKRTAWAILGTIVLVSLIAGVLSSFDDNGNLDLRGLVGNLSTELIGGVITFVLIDLFVTRSVDRNNQKKTLISQLENSDSNIVKGIVQQLRVNGWLSDGSLYGWFLKKANFEGIDLRDAKINGLGMFRCSLKDAKVHNHQLATLNDLRFTIMPDGTKYDGRYCLPGDIDWAESRYGIDFNDTTVEQLARYYDVTEESFIEGQRWAIRNLPEMDVEVPIYLRKLELNGNI